MTRMIRHFLDLDQIDAGHLRAILEDAKRRKAALAAGSRRPQPGPLAGKSLALILERPSTRTRVSFEVAMRQLGGDVLVLRPDEMQLRRGETLSDTARVLSRYVDAIAMRASTDHTLRELARYATVPVINGLTKRSHPCQIMADILTFEEHRGPIAGATVAWIGDGNNVCNSWIQAAVRFGFRLHIATPEILKPDATVLAWAREQKGKLTLTTDPAAAVAGVDLVVTDAWISMGNEATGVATDDDAITERHRLLAPYQVDDRLMSRAAPDALFMHCLPAHRGEEVTGSVLDGPQSVVFDEAENRLHAQKSILAWCLDAGFGASAQDLPAIRTGT